MKRTIRLIAPVLVAALLGVLALFPATDASAASSSKTCAPNGTNVYTCVLVITPGVQVGAGSWLVQMVPGAGTFTGGQTVTSASGCGPTTITAGTQITIPSDIADYDVTVGGAGCSATASVAITETITVFASGQVCQKVWVTPASPFTMSCANVTYTPPGAQVGTPGATKTCTTTGTINVYSCLYTVTPGFPAAGTPPSPNGDYIHVNEPPGPPMTGPGTFVSTPTVVSVNGCTSSATPVTLTSSTSYNAWMGASGCTGTTWSVTFQETIAVTASGQICQSFYMVASVPPVTTCANVTYTPPVTSTSSAMKTCAMTSTPNVYTCTFTLTPPVASPAGTPWLVQLVAPSPGTLTAPSVVTSSTGCGSGSATPSVTAGTLVNTQLGIANYNVTIGRAGCVAGSTVTITETVTVTASGQLCQTVWFNPASPGVTACAQVELAKSLVVPPTGGKSFATTPNFGMGLAAQAVFSGTVDELEAATMAAGGTGVWVQDSTGTFQLLLANGPMFLKDAFRAKFSVGFSSMIGVTLVRSR